MNKLPETQVGSVKSKKFGIHCFKYNAMVFYLWWKLWAPNFYSVVIDSNSRKIYIFLKFIVSSLEK